MPYVTGKRVKVHSTLWALAACLWLLSPVWAQTQSQVQNQAQNQARVSASLSSAEIAFEDSVDLEVVAQGTNGELDTTELETLFDIVRRSQGEQTVIVNGRTDSFRRWTLTLVPRITGPLTVPPVSVGGVSSQPLRLDVGNAPTGAERVLFVELDVDEPAPWVQQQVQVTLRIFHRIRIDDYAVTPPSADGISLLPIDDVVSRVERDGIEYRVIERRFMLFPQQSGRIELPSIVLTALVPADPSRVRTFMSPQRRLTRRTDPIVLDVQPRPDDVTANWWLPARSLTLSEEWSENAESVVQVGDVLSRQVTIAARGIHRTQLPDLATPDVQGASIYLDEPVDSMNVEPDNLLTQRVQSWAVIPQQPGVVSLPAVEIEWFDTVAGVARVATLPERTIEVQDLQANSATGVASGTTLNTAANPASNAALTEPVASGGPQSAAGSDNLDDSMSDTASTLTTPLQSPAALQQGGQQHWRTLAVVAMLGWAVTAGILLWRERRRGRVARDSGGSAPVSEPRTEQALKNLQEAARRSDASGAARAIVDWGRAQGAYAGLNSLPAVAKWVDDGRVADELYALDAHLYRGVESADPASIPGSIPGSIPEVIKLQRIHDCLSRTVPPAAGKSLPTPDSALPPL